MNSDSPNLVSVRYLADRLGVNVRTVWRLMAGDRSFPRSVKLGRSTRFVLSEIEDYFEALLARRKTI
jgi:predicted DNA-binding transcriptional regulator AlpA